MDEKYLVRGAEGMNAGVFRVEWKTVIHEFSASSEEEAKTQVKNDYRHLVNKELFKRIRIE